MNGYETHIFEMDTRPGGVCTAWKRKGYTIDGCMEWLVGSGPASWMHGVWQELGIIQNHSFIDHDAFMQVEVSGGKALSLYTDPARLEQHRMELAPEDGAAIRDLTNAMRKLEGFAMPERKAPEILGLFDRLREGVSFLPYMGVLRRWGKVTVGEFTSRLKSPLLREAFLAAVSETPDFPLLGLLMPMYRVQAKTAGYPRGGSFEFARTIEQRYLGLGGTVDYNARVERILVENDRAVGVRLADGSEHFGDRVVSAADGHSTIFDMLQGKYVNDTIKGYYRDLPLFPPMLLVSFGVARTFAQPPSSVGGILLKLDKPLTIAGKERTALNLYIYNHDPRLAPRGKTVVKFILMTDYDHWEALYKDREAYKAEKERIANILAEVLEKRFPSISKQVEMRDVATPMTWVRYTANWKASYEGWMMTMDTFGMRMSKTLPGLENFFMVGQWVEPGGGLPPAATSGRNLAQILCKTDGKKFVTTRP